MTIDNKNNFEQFEAIRSSTKIISACLKMLSSKHMLQSLPIALGQLEAHRLKLIDYYSILLIKNLKRSDKYVVLSNLSMYYRWKNIKKPCKNN